MGALVPLARRSARGIRRRPARPGVPHERRRPALPAPLRGRPFRSEGARGADRGVDREAPPRAGPRGEEGEGVAAVNSYIRSNRNRQNSLRAIRKVRECVNPLNYKITYAPEYCAEGITEGEGTIELIYKNNH